MPDTARALWFPRAQEAELRAETLPPTPPGQTRIRALFGGISRGTEAMVFSGRVPPSEYDRMRGPNQGGSFPFPVKYGYATVGLAGDIPVFCLHPHQTQFDAPEAYPLPPGLPPERAILAANMETALNIVWDAGIAPGDRVNIFGAGTVGLLTAWIAARIPGTDLRLTDPNPARATPARALNIPFGPPQPGSDIAINASASADALATAIDHAAPDSLIVEASWHSAPVTIPLGGAFHANRLRIAGSQVGNLPPTRRPRWTHTRRMQKALDLLLDPTLDALITGETAFDDLPARYGEILAAPDTICHRIRY